MLAERLVFGIGTETRIFSKDRTISKTICCRARQSIVRHHDGHGYANLDHKPRGGIAQGGARPGGVAPGRVR